MIYTLVIRESPTKSIDQSIHRLGLINSRLLNNIIIIISVEDGDNRSNTTESLKVPKGSTNPDITSVFVCFLYLLPPHITTHHITKMDYYTAFFTFVGFLAVANWTYITFRSLVWITYYNILEQLNPEKYSLEKRFGQWAGEIKICSSEWRNTTQPYAYE